MPTNNKTGLGLNSWVGTDKPKRSDFVSDNTLLDSLLTTHFGDSVKHLTDSDRTMLSQAFVTNTYYGNGQAQQEISLPFEPRMVFVCYPNRPVLYYRSSGAYYDSNFGIVTALGGTAGLSLNKAKLTVSQDQSNPAAGGIKTALNTSGSVYIYVAFR